MSKFSGAVLASFFMFYKSRRIGKNGVSFLMYKIQTLREGSDSSSFAQKDSYTRFGQFLRKTKLDELPQLINVLKGEMAFFGYRPEEVRTWHILPESIREVLRTQKPGMIDLASLYFMDEEKLLQMGGDSQQNYWEKIKPVKFVLQMFYIQNKSWLLNLAILWSLFKKIIKI